jgi:hypothetical protein
MHALVPTILIRTTWRDPVGPNVQFQQPDGKLRQPGQAAVARKRAAIVGAQRPRQPILPGRRDEQWLDLSEGRPRHGMGDQKIPAEIVRHRQWLAPNTVAGPGPAFEISRQLSLECNGSSKFGLRPVARAPYCRDVTKPSRTNRSPTVLAAGHS